MGLLELAKAFSKLIFIQVTEIWTSIVNMTIATKISLISLLISLISYIKVERQRRASFEIRVSVKVRKEITGSGFVLDVENRCDYDITLRKIKILYSGKKIFDTIPEIFLGKGQSTRRNVAMKATSAARKLDDMSPSTILPVKILMSCRTRYWGKKRISISSS
jgi:hypothetical protein